MPTSTISVAANQSQIRAAPSTKPPATITAIATKLGIAHCQTAFFVSGALATLDTSVMIPSSTMTDSEMAKTGPPSSNAVDTDAAIGTLTAVPIRKTTRTCRLLPDTALADQVNCDQGNQSSQNTSATWPIPVQSG